jgi:hypothetical protein
MALLFERNIRRQNSCLKKEQESYSLYRQQSQQYPSRYFPRLLG